MLNFFSLGVIISNLIDYVNIHTDTELFISLCMYIYMVHKNFKIANIMIKLIYEIKEFFADFYIMECVKFLNAFIT